MLLDQIKQFSHWQIDLIACWLLLQGAVVSIFPEEIIIITLGWLWGQGKLEFFEAFTSVLIGLLPANAMMVLIGKRVSRRFAEKQSVRIATRYVQKYGCWLVFLTRFTPVVRAPIYFSTGACQFTLWKFIRVDGSAACLHVPLLLFLGREMGMRSENTGKIIRGLGWIAGGIFATTLVLTLVIEHRRKVVPTSEFTSCLN
jgi:membrane protein DedA with SNARE-associated domain